MSQSPGPPRRPRSLSVVGDDPLPDVRIDGVDTVAMTHERHTAAVRALAALIDNWRVTAHTSTAGAANTEPGETDRPLAA